MISMINLRNGDFGEAGAVGPKPLTGIAALRTATMDDRFLNLAVLDEIVRRAALGLSDGVCDGASRFGVGVTLDMGVNASPGWMVA